MPASINLRMFGISSTRSRNKSCGVPQSSPITATRGTLLHACHSFWFGVSVRRSGREDHEGASAVRVSYQAARHPDPPAEIALVTFLRRILYVQTALWGLFGAAMAIAPGWLAGTVGGQPPVDHVWLRAMGVMSVVFALLMILVAQRLEDVWWWAWAFVVLEAGTATVFVLHALFGLPEGAAAWWWWTLAAVNGLIGALELIGLGLTAQEKPFA